MESKLSRVLINNAEYFFSTVNIPELVKTRMIDETTEELVSSERCHSIMVKHGDGKYSPTFRNIDKSSLLDFCCDKETGKAHKGVNPCPANGILNLHIVQSHPPIEALECYKCGQRFIGKCVLDQHLMHAACGFISEEYVLPCAVCGHIFTCSDNIDEHLISHMNETRREPPHAIAIHEAYKPLIGDPSFENMVWNPKPSKMPISAPKEIEDLRMHTTTDLHVCIICHKQFNRFACLRLHLRVFHPDVPFEIMTEGARERLKFLNSKLLFAVEADSIEMPIVPIKTPQTQSKAEENTIDYNYVQYIVDSSDEESMTIDTEDLIPSISIDDETAAENIKSPLPDKLPMPEKIIFIDDAALKESILQLLKLLLNDDILSQLGWPEIEVGELLSSVIKQCGHTPAVLNEFRDGMRENLKILMTELIDDGSVKSLINNHTVDEVLVLVLKMIQPN